MDDDPAYYVALLLPENKTVGDVPDTDELRGLIARLLPVDTSWDRLRLLQAYAGQYERVAEAASHPVIESWERSEEAMRLRAAYPAQRQRVADAASLSGIKKWVGA